MFVSKTQQHIRGNCHHRKKKKSLLLVHGIGTKLVLNWEQNMLYSKSWQFLCKKMMSILTDLKVSSLECKWISYRSEHWRIELTFQDLKIKKRNIPANGPQRVDEKNGVIWLTIMFNPRVAVTKMLKMANFLYFQQFLSDIFPIQTFFRKIWYT